MKSKVAIVGTTGGFLRAYQKAITLIGGIDSLNVKDRDITIKLGVYDPRALNHPTLEATKAVVGVFKDAHQIYLAESDNHVATALERLQLWREVFSHRVLPFSLSEDPEVREVDIAGEIVSLSHILFKPYFRVGFHALRGSRGPGQPLYGSILKNLLGIIPDIRKERFHNKLSVALVDMLEAIGGLDLAVIDATYTYFGSFQRGKPLKRIRTELLIVGKDAVAVDAVGYALVGREPLEIYSLLEAMNRGLGQADLEKIKIEGEPIENVKIEDLNKSSISRVRACS